MTHMQCGKYTPRRRPPATTRSAVPSAPSTPDAPAIAALAMVLFLSLFLSLDACRKSAPPDGVAGSLEPVRADVLAAFQRSREALRRLDVEAYLAGYASGPGLVVQDPAGEFRGREAFERFVREWFAEARKKGPTYALVTSNESVYPLDERTAVVVVHWSAPAGQGPHGSLLVYRQEEGVWRIAAEQSAPLPEVDGAPRDR